MAKFVTDTVSIKGFTTLLFSKTNSKYLLFFKKVKIMPFCYSFIHLFSTHIYWVFIRSPSSQLSAEVTERLLSTYFSICWREKILKQRDSVGVLRRNILSIILSRIYSFYCKIYQHEIDPDNIFWHFIYVLLYNEGFRNTNTWEVSLYSQ